jgi:glutaminyl-peptide cyclotransferase
MKKISAIFVIILIISSGCNFSGKEKKPQQQAEQKPLKMMAFSGDSAYRYVAEQLAFGPRVMNTKAHDKCEKFLAAKLGSYTKDLTLQKGTVTAFNGTPLKLTNIIASFGPAGANRIILASHWDSRPFADHDKDPAKRRKPIDGANDGASGVGILLEIARQLSINPPPVGVDLILFDAEDYGPPQDDGISGDTEIFWGQGAQYWSNTPHKPGYNASYGILLDMVGAPNATFLMEGYSVDYANDVLHRVWDIGNRAGYGAYFRYDRGGYITDDHLPVNRVRRIPMIDLIHLDRDSDTGFYPFWHTTGDNLSQIDKTTLEVVGKTLMAVIFNP